MSIQAQLNSAVNSAFTACGDLVVQVTLNKADSSGYNFATGTAAKSTTSVTVDGILLDETKSMTDGNRAIFVLYLKSAEVPNIDTYDTFTIAGNPYRLHEYNDNGFLIEAKVSGGANG